MTKHKYGKSLGIAAAIAIAIFLYWWFNRKFPLVTHSITYNGSSVENATLENYLSRMFPQEYITADGKLASNVNGHITVYQGDPIDILSRRSNNG